MDPLSLEDVRARARRWFEDNWAPDATIGQWWERLARSGWGFPSFPAEWFGKGLGVQDARAVHEERRAVGAAAPPDRIGATAIAPLLIEHATDDEKRRWLPDTLCDKAVWCELFSEPGAGSDLASMSTRAERSGDEWLVTGQKLWASGAPFARWGLLVARTDPDVGKHQGLTCFVLDMDQPAVDVRPLVAMTGEAEFNEVFLTRARVPSENLIGRPGGGWAIVKAALDIERRAMGSAGLGDNSTAPDLGRRAGDVAAAELAGRRRGSVSSGGGAEELMRTVLQLFGSHRDAVLRQDVAHLFTLLRIAGWTAMRTRASGAGPEASTSKLMSSAISRAQRDLLLRIEGAAGMLAGHDAALKGVVQRLALWSPAQSLMVGTDEVQRNVIGERVLGLPGEPDETRGLPWRLIPRS
jgi:alkylation response protein AidB-like acyl-CoA dehydrogenase